MKEEDGTPHAFSAACPHKGCTLTWNNADRTWDCPCHGSRFDGYGRVLNGPAVSDLASVEHEEKSAGNSNELVI